MRAVRVTDEFWADLDHGLPGRASHDFTLLDLPGIIDRLAERWDEEMPLVGDHPRYRQVIGAGRIAYWAVDAQLAPDGAVELIRISVDVVGLGEE